MNEKVTEEINKLSEENEKLTRNKRVFDSEINSLNILKRYNDDQIKFFEAENNNVREVSKVVN